MKTRIFVLLLALCLCLAGACESGQGQSAPTAQPLPSSEDTPAPAEDTQEPAEDTSAQAPEDDSGTDLVLPGEPGFVDDSGTDIPDAPAQTDWTALSADECVEDAWPTEGVIPRIVLDCEGADEINGQIEERFVPLADDPMCQGLSYECSRGVARVLSVLMVERGPNDTVYYTPFNLDLETGQALSGQELLSLLGVDAARLINLEQAVMGEEFTHQFGTAEGQTDPDFFNEQYERTTAPENTETERIWLSDDGQLYFVGRIYGMAGAECYEYPMSSTLLFS